MNAIVSCDAAVVAAMDCEAQSIVAALSGVRSETVRGRLVSFGEAGGRRYAVIVSGIGKVNAASAAELAISALGAKEIVNAGVAGGLERGMKVADVYEIGRAAEYDFDLSVFNGGRIGVKDGADTAYAEFSPKGLFPVKTLATGDRFNDSEEDNRLITETIGCSVRDMEGAAVAYTAAISGATARSVKSISDVAGSGSMPEQYLRNKTMALASLTDALRVYFTK